MGTLSVSDFAGNQDSISRVKVLFLRGAGIGFACFIVKNITLLRDKPSFLSFNIKRKKAARVQRACARRQNTQGSDFF